MATARLSGMMLDYQKLMKYGINGLIDLLKSKESNDFIEASIEAMELLKDVIRKQKEFVLKAKETASSSRSKDLDLMYESLDYILENKPKTFHQALQLFGFMLYVQVL